MPYRAVTLKVPDSTKTMVVRLDVDLLVDKLKDLRDTLSPEDLSKSEKAAFYDSSKSITDPHNEWALSITHKVREAMMDCSDSQEMQDPSYSFLAALSLIIMLREGKAIPNQSIN